MDNRDVRLLSVENEALLTCNFTSYKSVWKIMEIAPVDSTKKDLTSMYRPLKMATTVYERGIGRGEKNPPPF